MAKQNEEGNPPMQGRTLWCDLGNSRLKGAWSPDAEDYGALDFARPGLAPLDFLESGPNAGEPSALATWSAALAGCEQAWLASVAAPARRQACIDWLADQGVSQVRTNPEVPLELRIRHPETAGLDRLYAALAAWQLVGERAAICVDAGTALTVDAIVPGTDPKRPAFLGGAIAPGPRLLARSLQSGGAQLWHVEPEPGVPALGRETSEALASGIVVGFEGAAAHLVQRIAQEAGIPEAPIVLTGGAASYLLRAFPSHPGGLVIEPDLVLRGLRLAARADS